ncbi:MAG: glutaminase A [Proteobacteria bacterium]|nr:glutaminase A [Pseudomonadota bacterium]
MKSSVGRFNPWPRLARAVWLIVVLTLTLGAPLWAPAGDREPDADAFRQALQAAHQRFKGVSEGKNADYIPYLAEVDSRLFGLAIATVDGKVYEVGDSSYAFAIESISKVFTLCRVIEDLGDEAIAEKIGVNASEFPFNSVMAIELEKSRTINSFVNAGAMATTSLVPGKTPDERWGKIIGTMNGFAGRPLEVNEAVYRSESETNMHNQAIVVLLKSYGRFYADPIETLDLYTRQCSVSITARDLAVMGATLANGGLNPMTGKRVMDGKHVPRVLALMLTNGLYETTGDWSYWTGLPGKSGVGGGIVAVVPGRYALASFSPPLDTTGNSVRGLKAIRYLSERLRSNIFLPR